MVECQSFPITHARTQCHAAAACGIADVNELAARYRIATIPGDGVGPDVVAAARRVVEATGSAFGFDVEWSEFLVGGGLLHYIVPMATLTLLGTIQNVDPRLFDAAQALGAPGWRAHLGITLPLCMRGLLAAFSRLQFWIFPASSRRSTSLRSKSNRKSKAWITASWKRLMQR